jgi:hypothetical protein
MGGLIYFIYFHTFVDMEDRSWMSLRNRTCAEYLDGLKSFISAEEDMLNEHKTATWCPCIDCKNEKQYSRSLSVYGHLVMQVFMSDYRCWNKHGEGVNDGDSQAREEGVNDGDSQAGCMDQGFSSNIRQDDGTHAASQDNEERPFCSPDLSDEKIADISANYVQMVENIEEMVRDAMGFDEFTEVNLEMLKRLVVDMKMPLYLSCKENYTKLFATLKLLQLKATHRWTDRSFDELLDLLRDICCLRGMSYPRPHMRPSRLFALCL